jgi:small GTP-binding protein
MSQPSVKAVLVGDESVGKTAIFKRLEDNTFDSRQPATIGGSYLRLTVTDGHGSSKDIGLWDTAGAERYRSIVPMYFQRAQIVICVFDLTSDQSFQNISIEWVKMVRNKAPADVEFLIIGNKSDLDKDRRIDLPAAQQLSEQIGAKAYIETSALNGTGIDLLKTQLGVMVAAEKDDWDVVETVEPQETGPEGAIGGCLNRC